MATRKPSARREVSLIRVPEVLDAIEELGIVQHACAAVGFDRRTLYRMMESDASVAEAVRIAVERGREKRRDFLESLAYKMAPENPVMVMFLLKREDPSYRESYNVNTTNAPTNFVIDLGTADTSLDAAPASDEVPSVQGEVSLLQGRDS
jgi:hypothetical protein